MLYIVTRDKPVTAQVQDETGLRPNPTLLQRSGGQTGSAVIPSRRARGQPV
jgi:hypothetical protein